jgi:hypothetical protein
MGFEDAGLGLEDAEEEVFAKAEAAATAFDVIFALKILFFLLHRFFQK